MNEVLFAARYLNLRSIDRFFQRKHSRSNLGIITMHAKCDLGRRGLSRFTDTSDQKQLLQTFRLCACKIFQNRERYFSKTWRSTSLMNSVLRQGPIDFVLSNPWNITRRFEKRSRFELYVLSKYDMSYLMDFWVETVALDSHGFFFAVQILDWLSAIAISKDWHNHEDGHGKNVTRD